MIKHIHYNNDKTKQLINYYNNKRIKEKIKKTITFKYACKLCDFYTNHYILLKRHINSNNHYIRKNQF